MGGSLDRLSVIDGDRVAIRHGASTQVVSREALRLIPVRAVEEMRYLVPTAARSWFGMLCLCTGGVIVVTTHIEG